MPGDHPLPLDPAPVDELEAGAHLSPGRGPGALGVASLGQPEPDRARARLLRQGGQVLGLAPDERVPHGQRHAVGEAAVLVQVGPHDVGEAVDPGRALGVGAREPGEPERGSLDGDGRVLLGQPHDRPAGLAGQGARLPDGGRVELEDRLALGHECTSRPSKRRRTAALSRSRLHGVVSMAGDVAVADQHRDVGGQALGAERRGGERGRHREEDDRAPGDVARMAPPSQPGTSTQTTVMSAVPPTADTTASRVAIGSRASATTTSSARPEARSSAASASWGTMPTVRRAPASAAAARLSEPGLARAADDGDHRPARTCADDAVGQRRRTADVHHGEAELGGQVVGDHGGDGAAEQHGVAVARAPAPTARPSRPGRPR